MQMFAPEVHDFMWRSALKAGGDSVLLLAIICQRAERAMFEYSRAYARMLKEMRA